MERSVYWTLGAELENLLDALVWAYKRTKAFQGMLPVVVRTDKHALIEKWKSQGLYDSDIRVFR